MRALKLLWVFALALGACQSPDDGYAIDLDVTFDSTVSLSSVQRTTRLHLEVSGAEEFVKELDVAGKFTSRSAGLRYKPGAQSGLLTFALTAFDDAGSAFASGNLANVELKAGETQRFTLTLFGTSDQPDGSIAEDLGDSDFATCGNGVIDDGEACDPGAGSAMPCPASAADCDDQNPCTDDAISGAACGGKCTHNPAADNIGCSGSGDGGTGVCLGGACCMGCIKDGKCLPGTDDPKACGAGGNSCFDCTQNAASATCNGGQCSGCDATSCATDGRTCGTSSCGYNCGGCPDSCAAGAVTHYTCASKTCQQNGGGNCGIYATCASSTTCNTQCNVDGDCIATAWCDQATKTCKPKGVLGAACSGESTGDRECGTGACSWRPDVKGGFCTAAHCDGCKAASSTGSCDTYIQYGLNPRNWCVYQNACQRGFCSGGPDSIFLGKKIGTQKEGCDYGVDPFNQNVECGSSTCSAGQVTSVCTLTVSGGIGYFECQPTNTIACSALVNGVAYSCPCANGVLCSRSISQCTPK